MFGSCTIFLIIRKEHSPFVPEKCPEKLLSGHLPLKMSTILSKTLQFFYILNKHPKIHDAAILAKIPIKKPLI